jgi:MmyB-like transcription regulator ligand binding domain
VGKQPKDPLLADLVHQWRARLTRDQVPEAIRGEYVFSSNHAMISQAGVARIIAYWAELSTGEPTSLLPHSFQRLERGEVLAYGEWLRFVSMALRLNEDEDMILRRRATGRPPELPRPKPLADGQVADIIEWVQRSGIPAYAYDRCWNVLTYNPEMAKLFPFLNDAQPNAMRWVLLNPSARTWLVNWAGDWAARMLALLDSAHAEHPEDDELAALREEVAPVRKELAGKVDVPVGLVSVTFEHRWVNLPDYAEPVEVVMYPVELSPLPVHQARLMTVIPHYPMPQRTMAKFEQRLPQRPLWLPEGTGAGDGRVTCGIGGRSGFSTPGRDQQLDR